MDGVFLVWMVLCVSGSLASFSIPSDVYISLFSSTFTSQEKQAALSAISQVNLDATLLPNTTLHIAEVTSSDQNLLSTALNFSQNKVSSMIVSSKPKESHDALSSLLHTPLLSTRPAAVSLNQSFSRYGVSMGSNLHNAMVDLITNYSWTNLIVLYDVRWRDDVSLFTSSLPSNVQYLPIDMVLDQTGLINLTTQNKLKTLCNDPADAIALFCDASLVQGIINQVHPLLTQKIHRTHRWLLADRITSLKLAAEISQIIIGFLPRVFINPKTTVLMTALSTNITTTKFSSFLIFDAVLTYAQALHNMVVDNQWQSLITGSDIVKFRNGDELLKYIKKVRVTGTTGVIQFDDGGHRRNAVIDVMNLRGGTFIKIGEWSETPKLTMTSPPLKNQPILKVVPLSQLQRKLKIALVEDPPFVMVEVDKQTNTKKLVGFSVDLVKGIADMLKFQYEFYLSPDGKYGGANPDGTLSGVIGEVFKGNADMSSMPLTINSERLQYIGFSKPFMYISMDLVMKKPSENGFDITGFMTPYTINVWIMTLVTWFVVTAVLTLVNFFSPYGHRLCDEEENGDEFSWFNSLWFCLASMLQQGGDSTPRMLSGRIVVGSFWFCVLVWVSTYTANLAAFLTSSKHDIQINTLEDVLESEYSMYIMRDTALFEQFKTSDYRVYRLLYERMSVEKTFVDSASEGFNFVRKIEKTVYIEESPFAEYLINQEPCDVMSARDVTGSSTYGIAMSKYSPYINNISIAILQMQELGQIETLKRRWWNERNKCPVVKQQTSEEIIESMRIQIGNMVGVYFLLAAGGVISIVVIFVEIWWKNRRDRINAKVRQGWAVVKGAKTVIGLQRQTAKPNAITVVQAFQSKLQERNMGITDNTDFPAKSPASSWGVVSKMKLQAQQNEKPKMDDKDLGVDNGGYNGFPAKTSTNTWEVGSDTKSEVQPIEMPKDDDLGNYTRFYNIPAKTSSTPWGVVTETNVPGQLNENPKKDSKHLGNTNDDFPAKNAFVQKNSKKKSSKLQTNEQLNNEASEVGSETSEGFSSSKEKTSKKKTKNKEKKEKKERKGFKKDDEEYIS